MWRAFTLSSHAGHFFCVFLLILIRIKYSINCLFSAEAILIRIKYSKYCLFSAGAKLFPVWSLVVGNMPYGKRHTSRTEPVLVQA